MSSQDPIERYRRAYPEGEYIGRYGLGGMLLFAVFGFLGAFLLETKLLALQIFGAIFLIAALVVLSLTMMLISASGGDA